MFVTCAEIVAGVPVVQYSAIRRKGCRFRNVAGFASEHWNPNHESNQTGIVIACEERLLNLRHAFEAEWTGRTH
jgi:hypothetical protein